MRPFEESSPPPPARSAPVVLRMTDVHHGYGDRTVLAGASMTLRAGTCLVIRGDNGSGKSTLLRLAAGRERPRAGAVTLDGRPADEDDPRQRAAVAAVLEDDAHHPDLSVREHLLLVALAHGLADTAEGVVDGALTEHRLTEQADLPPDHLSSGQRRLLALAASVVRPHRLLILDEPEAGLDRRARRRLADRLRAARARGVALLVACHDDRLARAVADTVLRVTPAGRLVPDPPGEEER
ncbi:ATP-binding cassette domain-containing protein [Streptomyces sp. ST2-7A]|uniref:ABC transporter ATP-binding protein n=1 Tax=Streptomyces sp. ST2-7A TaxID=2907214 RepID=UPI001F25DC4D|nr:ATP-binding cassette domain-containing protein [Streptomyces sp. ST2-7A]MCE7079879.1 ATP-binding cassette domain-containing protein [Streptomyces sp. ST2-7A]